MGVSFNKYITFLWDSFQMASMPSVSRHQPTLVKQSFFEKLILVLCYFSYWVLVLWCGSLKQISYWARESWLVGLILYSWFRPSFKNAIRVSNSLNPHQAWHFVWPDLVPSCLQRLSADDTIWQRVNEDELLVCVFVGTQYWQRVMLIC